ncbi:hypothetical protein ACFPN2_07350 [Steroidobacter flavus]|uniref:Lipoprotein n=1 Tax=Steroidobacter flavus TaxID=1842136 RepID=A0ABV8SMV4_9GAMM
MSIGRLLVALTLISLVGCATIPNRPARPARSSYSCMETVVKEKVPTHAPDKRQHCLAGGFIARYCSGSEAYLAGAGKEIKDLFGGGDAEWGDWRADRAGIACARSANDDDALAKCCEQSGY